MAELKTKPTDASVADFLASVAHERRRRDALLVCDMMARITGLEPVMWGPSIVGYGSYRYETGSGHKGEFFLTGFSPRKQALTVYVMLGFEDYPELMARLGKVKTGRSCLYINKLDDVDLATLEELIRRSYNHMKEKYGA